MTHRIAIAFAAILLLPNLPLPVADKADKGTDDPDGTAFFEKNIRPVLQDQCYACHHARTLVSNYEAGLLLDSLEGLLKGGNSGLPAIVPGDPDKSPLIQAIRYTKTGKDAKKNMPPKWGKDLANGGKLPDATIKHFEQWIQRGAPVPDDFKKPPTLPTP